MADTFPPTAQRPKLLELAEALDSRSDALRRDEFGDWRIFGKFGHVYACPEGFQLVALELSTRGWALAKERLAFCELTQDGDGEGCLILDRLPSAEEGEIIRRTLGIFKRRHLSDEQRERMTEILLAHPPRRGQNPVLSASDDF